VRLPSAVAALVSARSPCRGRTTWGLLGGARVPARPRVGARASVLAPCFPPPTRSPSPTRGVCGSRWCGVGCGGGCGGVRYMHVWVYACMQHAYPWGEPWVHTRCSPGYAARTPPSSPSPCTRGARGGCPVPRHTRGVAEASQRGGCEARERGVNPGTHAVLPGLCGARGFSPPPSFPLPTLSCLAHPPRARAVPAGVVASGCWSYPGSEEGMSGRNVPGAGSVSSACARSCTVARARVCARVCG